MGIRRRLIVFEETCFTAVWRGALGQRLLKNVLVPEGVYVVEIVPNPITLFYPHIIDRPPWYSLMLAEGVTIGASIGWVMQRPELRIEARDCVA